MEEGHTIPVESKSMVVLLYPLSLLITKDRMLESIEKTRCLWTELVPAGMLCSALTLEVLRGPDTRLTQPGNTVEEALPTVLGYNAERRG